MTELKFYCYNQSGLLLNARNVRDFCQVYGEPLCTSSNGQNMIFKHKDTFLIKIKDQDQRMKMYLSFTVVKMTPFGLIHIKDVNLMDRLNQYFSRYSSDAKLKRNDEFRSFEEMTEALPWINSYESAIVSKLNVNFKLKLQINDEMDICVKMKEVA